MIDLYKGDCLEVMDELIAKGITVDAIITDPPYQEVECKWDKIIPFDEMWLKLNKLIKPNGAMVLFGSFKFGLQLVGSNYKMFKYELVWNKVKPSNIFTAKLRPMNIQEYIYIFSNGTIANGSKRNMCYYPIMEEQKERISKLYGQSDLRYRKNLKSVARKTNKKYPKSILEFSNANQKGKVHPTQKPQKLMEYLISTYTNENELVLDFTMGSGTTGVACKNLNRNFIGIEMDDKYFDIAKKRIEES